MALDPPVHSRNWRKDFFFLWAAAIVSQIANFLMLVTLSVILFRTTHSSFTASVIFALQWVAPALFGRVIRWVCESFAPHRSLIAIEWLSAAVTLAVGFTAEFSVWWLPVLLLPRGVLEGTAKAVRIVAAKQVLPGERLRTYNPLLNTALPLGTALSSLLGALLIDRLDTHAITLVSCALAMAAGLLSLCVRTRHPAAAFGRGAMQLSAITILRRKASLWKPAVLLMTTVSVFQSYHNVARTIYPLQFLGLPASSVMQLQIVSSVAIILGAIAVSGLERLRLLPKGVSVSWILGACALMCAIVQLHHPALGYTVYFFFMFVFEVAYCRYQTAMVDAADPSEIAAASSFISALSPLTAGAMIAVLALLVDALGFVPATWLAACATVAGALLLHLRHHPRSVAIFQPEKVQNHD